MKKVIVSKLNNKQKLILAEFIYSYDKDILVNQDVIAAKKCLSKMGANSKYLEHLSIFGLYNYIRIHLDDIIGLMDGYYK
jgi:hypothetical protein